MLGAGRLFDFDATALLPRFASLRLVDADPLCKSAWDAKIDKPFEPVFTDISGCIDEWLVQLRQLPGSPAWAETLEFIRSRHEPATPTTRLRALSFL